MAMTPDKQEAHHHVGPLSRNRDPNITKFLHVRAICCRPETYNDVISSLAVDNFGVDVPIKFVDSRSNGFRDIRGADFVSKKKRTNERTLNDFRVKRTNIAGLRPQMCSEIFFCRQILMRLY